ncbi:MAG: patatin-like phospholipase family protein [Nitrospira sp.]|nr:MAG: patatin-like phospholipase family protein [Nitrospira sp.]
MRPLVTLQNANPVLIAICLLVSGCSTQPLPGALTQTEYLQQGIEDRTHSKGTAPHLGLALAGGGTKAADFSIGMLQGLTEAEIMDQVDAISTVSGGGYAALWYFSRLLNPAEFPRNFLRPFDHKEFAEKFFADCIPYKYVNAEFIPDSLPENKPSSENRSSGNCPQTTLTNFYRDKKNPDKKTGFELDQVRYQNHLRGYQDIFVLNLPLIDSFRYEETTRDQGRNWSDFGLLTALTVGSLPLNILLNTMFDWEIPLSLSRWKYENGIVRTFGATPANCTQTTCSEQTRPEGNEDWTRTQLTFDLLKEHYENGMIPLWIINTTAGENRDVISAGFNPGQKPFQLTSFEFSPYGSGSGLFRYSSKTLGNLLPWKAVTSSAAFLDSQQKVAPPFYNPLLKFFTLDWGRSIPNPHIHWSEAVFHRLLPFPLYFFHGRAGNSASDYVNIRLSDGGQSENLGAYALIQRKLPDIIVSDHSADRSGRMEDVCRLRNGLQKDHEHGAPLYIYFPGLTDLDEVCHQDSNFGYDVFNWDHPILLGCITSDRSNDTCREASSVGQQHNQC